MGPAMAVRFDQIAAIDAPTWVIGCARDLVHPLALAGRLADAIVGAQLIEAVAKADEPLALAMKFAPSSPLSCWR
jgi:pimeloyl-ACP methyl ester carboxylesterase